jgi:hypothetical protein
MMNDEDQANVARRHESGKESGVGRSLPSARERISKAVPYVISVAAVIISALAYFDQHNTDRAAATSAEQAYAVKASFWAKYRPSPAVGRSAHTPVVTFTVLPPSIRSGPRWNTAHFLGYSQSSDGTTYLFEAPETNNHRAASAEVMLSESAGLIENGNVEVMIENQANAPISNVDLIVDARNDAGMVVGTRAIDVGTVPPCSIAKVSTIQQVAASLMNKVQATTQNGVYMIIPPTMGLASMVFTDSLGARWERSQNGVLAKYVGRQVSGSSSIEYPTTSHISAAPGCSAS